MVQQGARDTPAIFATFTPCGSPFRKEVSCVASVTIKDIYYTVCGTVVDLPFTSPDNGLVILDLKHHLLVVTFHGFVVCYSKNRTLSSLSIAVPTQENYRGWWGMCGFHDGSKVNDFYSRFGEMETDTSIFVGSWRTQRRSNQCEIRQSEVCGSVNQQSEHTSTCDDLIQALCSCELHLMHACYQALLKNLEETCLDQGVSLLSHLNASAHPIEWRPSDVNLTTTADLTEKTIQFAEAISPAFQAYFGRAALRGQFIPATSRAIRNALQRLKPALLRLFLNSLSSFTDFLEKISPALVKFETVMTPVKMSFLEAFGPTFQALLQECQPLIHDYVRWMIPVCEKFFNQMITVIHVLGKRLGPILIDYFQKGLEGDRQIFEVIKEELIPIFEVIKRTDDSGRINFILKQLWNDLEDIKASEEENLILVTNQITTAIETTVHALQASGYTDTSLKCTLDPTGLLRLLCGGCRKGEPETRERAGDLEENRQYYLPFSLRPNVRLEQTDTPSTLRLTPRPNEQTVTQPTLRPNEQTVTQPTLRSNEQTVTQPILRSNEQTVTQPTLRSNEQTVTHTLRSNEQTVTHPP
ncbi:hypothetical protein Hamer_G017360, partial [Homarus americanus]